MVVIKPVDDAGIPVRREAARMRCAVEEFIAPAGSLIEGGADARS
jgi:hypothetical protein